MTIRFILFSSLTALAASAPAQDPPPTKDTKTNLSASVTTLNGMFKKDPDGTLAKKYVGRVVTVSGTVKEVTADGEGQKLTLEGLPATATDPSGCAIAFPADHKSLGIVKNLKAGMSVRVRGEIGSVTGTAFTLKHPTLMSASAAPLAKGPAAPTPSPKSPAPTPKPEPAPDLPALKPEDLKTTAVALTSRLRDDKTEKLWLAYAGKEVEVTGPVRYSSRGLPELGNGWGLGLLGCPSSKPDLPFEIRMSFPADSPDLSRLRSVTEGDTVTVRGEFGMLVGTWSTLKNVRLVAGGEKPPPILTPVRTADAEAFVKELLADPAAADKLRGQAVALTGAIGSTDPKYTRYGLSLRAGKLKPTDSFGVFADCVVVDDQLDAVWQLPPGQKVRVVGELRAVEKDRVRLAKCRVTLAEPNPMPTLTATALATAFREDPKAATEKYGGLYSEKWLFLTGEVAALTPNQYGVTVALKVPAGPKVELGVERALAEGLKVGQAVRFKVACRGMTDDKATVRVTGQLLPEAKASLPLEK